MNRIFSKVISGGHTGVDRANLNKGGESSMPVLDFRNKLISTIKKAPIPQGIRTETEFEKKFLIPVMLQVSLEFPGVRLYNHPWREMPSPKYPRRTEKNIRESDGTLVLTWGPITGGTALMVKLAGETPEALSYCGPIL
jgi:hypothetical protein